MEDINDLVEQLDEIRNQLLYGSIEIEHEDLRLIESAVSDIDNAIDMMRRVAGW